LLANSIIMSSRLSAERVFFTHPQVKKISEAIRNKQPVKININKDNLIGSHPLFVREKDKQKINKARRLGRGCTCLIDVEALEKMGKAGKGLFMFGETPVNKFTKRPPTLHPQEQVEKGSGIYSRTGNTSAHAPTFRKRLTRPKSKQTGEGMFMFGEGSGGAIPARLTYGSTDFDIPQTYQ
jgi:hypothetical protein